MEGDVALNGGGPDGVGRFSGVREFRLGVKGEPAHGFRGKAVVASEGFGDGAGGLGEERLEGQGFQEDGESGLAKTGVGGGGPAPGVVGLCDETLLLLAGEAEGAGEVYEQPGTVFFGPRLPGCQRIREVLAQGGGFVRGGKGIEEGQGMRVVEVGNDEAAVEGVQLGLRHPARQQRLHPGLGERSPDSLFNRLVEIVFQGHGGPLGCRGGYGGVIQHQPNEGKWGQRGCGRSSVPRCPGRGGVARRW